MLFAYAVQLCSENAVFPPNLAFDVYIVLAHGALLVLYIVLDAMYTPLTQYWLMN